MTIRDLLRARVDLRNLAAFALRSPARLAAVAGVAAVVVIMLAHVLTPAATPQSATPARPTEPAGAQSGAPSGAPHDSATPTITAHTARPASSPSSAGSSAAVPPDVTDMSELADQFVATWADHTLTRADWFQAVRPMITPRLARVLRYTKPANVPASRVTGAAVVDPGPPIVVDVPTDAGTVHVLIVAAGQDYRVDRITS